MSRVRRVDDRRALERSIDEFITRGYRLMSEGETSARLKEKDWGDGVTHFIVVALTGWWTFGLANALYAIYSYVTADEIVIKLEGEPAEDESTAPTHDSERESGSTADGSESGPADDSTGDRLVGDALEDGFLDNNTGDERTNDGSDHEPTDNE